MTNKKIGVFVGSLRKESFNKKIANYLVSNPPAGLELEILEIGQLPYYNEDLDQGNPPKEYVDFRKAVSELDAVLFVTPEYNRGVSAVLKNAIDVASRPYGKNVWNGKPGGVISSSIGAIGGFGANHHLRQSLVFINVPTMAQPEAYIGNVAANFDEQGKLVNKDCQKFLDSFMAAYKEWIEKFLK
ncbi:MULTISPECIES: NADPH-dependent FMN reductase [Sphingobacterium]|uniref:NADPH-dependent FMN reductase n=1 Tax=Sphingobacterium TaxID=28453 RepID=UPI001627CDF5|nr:MULTISPECIES: NAD(P)H-dependent oxidoreductase [Sphingobacterium]MBV2225867.1 NAD(P)H-dependent oxidoreductase [Sphingobacterium mizutaii]